jgi:magnesium-transporting ATPase (P-type)
VVGLAGTVFFAGVVAAQIGNTFTTRRERSGVHELGWFSNPYLLGGILFELLLALTLIYFVPLALMFDLVSIPPVLWVGLAVYPLILYTLDRVRKGIAERLDHQGR